MDLEQFFALHPKAAIAFSGGVDSALLLYEAVRLGAQVKAYYAVTAFQPQFELEDARRLAQQLQVPVQLVAVDVLSLEEVAKNPSDRCYHCKKALFGAILQAARADGFDLLLDGTNASDDAADRPGMRALEELQVLSPLRLCGLTKEQIRRRSAEAGLFTHDKPAYACLATRIPTGETITREKLARTEAAENLLHSFGFRDFRVRSRDAAALLQVREEDIGLVMEHRQEILNDLKQAYAGVMLDLEVRK